MVTIHHPQCCVSRSIWSLSADGSNCPDSYWPVTESNLMAGSLMMMSSVPLHWDPVQFQKQIQPFIFQIIVAVYQLLPVFYLSLRLMWSFSQTAFCANSIAEHTCRTACLCACVCMCTCKHVLGFANEQARMALVHYKTPILLETIIHLMLSFFPTLFCCIYLWDHFAVILSAW